MDLGHYQGSNFNPREISNVVCQAPKGVDFSHNKLTDFVWAWGQFLDHEMDLTLGNR